MSNDSHGHQDSSEGYEDPAMARCGAPETGMQGGVRSAIAHVEGTPAVPSVATTATGYYVHGKPTAAEIEASERPYVRKDLAMQNSPGAAYHYGFGDGLDEAQRIWLENRHPALSALEIATRIVVGGGIILLAIVGAVQVLRSCGMIK